MCMMCNGASLDDVLFHLDAVIHRNGHAVVPVRPSSGRHGWAYTIGLTERYGHPELVVAGLAPAQAVALLDAAGELIADGRHLLPDHADGAVVCGVGPVRAVHHRQVTAGLMALWERYYGSLGRLDLGMEALQLCAPLPARGRGLAPPRLDRPVPLLAGGRA